MEELPESFVFRWPADARDDERRGRRWGFAQLTVAAPGRRGHAEAASDGFGQLMVDAWDEGPVQGPGLRGSPGYWRWTIADTLADKS
jgi:hypothetical protein